MVHDKLLQLDRNFQCCDYELDLEVHSYTKAIGTYYITTFYLRFTLNQGL